MNRSGRIQVIGNKAVLFANALRFWPGPGANGNQWYELKAVRFTLTLDRKVSQSSQIALGVVAGNWPNVAVSTLAIGRGITTNEFEQNVFPMPLYRVAKGGDARTTGSLTVIQKDYELMPTPGPVFSSFTIAALNTTGSETWDFILELYVEPIEPSSAGELARWVKDQGGVQSRRGV